uniref:Uncharacterized protein n=1 Tax=Ditylenchus dipsaci TaxID=166011 RepID=A0A915EQQ6_9BILA
MACKIAMTSAYSSPPRIIVGYSSPSPSSSSAQKPTVATTTTQQTIYRVPTSNFSYNMASTPPAYMDNCNSSNADTSATNKPTDVKNHHIFVHDNSHNYNLDRQRNEGLLHSESAEVRVTSSSPNGGELKLLDASGTSSTSSYSAENCQPQYSVLSSIPPQFSSQQQNGVEYVVVHDNMQQQKHEMQRVLHPEPMNSTGRMLMHAVDAELEEDLLEDLAYEYSDHSKSGGNGTRRVKDAQRKRRRRADESSAEAEARRAKNLAAKRRRLEKETEDEKQKRRARDAETKRVRRQRETPEQRSRRLTRDSERMRRTRRIKNSSRLLGPTIAALDSEEHKKE